jgi:LDH2 family malate/lactate/ureidoglycolate dehydrogenase
MVDRVLVAPTVTRVVAICGAPAVGKTTLGVRLGRAYVVPTAVIDTDWMGSIWPWREGEKLFDLIAHNLISVVPRYLEWGARVLVIPGVMLPGGVLTRIQPLLDDPRLGWVFYGLRASADTLAGRIAGDTAVQDPELRRSMIHLDAAIGGIKMIRNIDTNQRTAEEVFRHVVELERRDEAPIARTEMLPEPSLPEPPLPGPSLPATAANSQQLVTLDKALCVRLCAAALTGRGVDETTAEECGQALVASESAGVPSHGLIRILEYCAALDSGELNADTEPEVESSGSTFVIYGRRALGTKTVRLIRECLRTAVDAPNPVFVRVVAGGHLGRLSAIVEGPARDGLVALAFTNYCGTGQKVAVADSAQPRLGTNPLAFACPVAGERPVIVDISTSAWSEGRVRVAAARGVPVPHGVLVDRRGEFVNDPAQLYTMGAALAPLGAGPAGTAHKGYALAVMVELLGGALGGATICHEDASEGIGGNGGLFMAFPPAILGHTAAWLAAQVKALEGHLQRARPLDPGRPVRLPGRAEVATGTSIRIPRDFAQRLEALGTGVLA